MKKLPTLVFDIETAPLNGDFWRADQNYIGHEALNEDSFVICWSAKWYGESKVYSDCVTPEQALARDDRSVVSSLAEMMREAELLIAHNGDKFDLPRINGRLMVLRQEPLTPVKMIDTLRLARKSFDLPYNKLDFLAELLLDDHKIRTDFDLWRLAVRGDERALEKMVRYNRKDVTLLERVFNVMKPYVKGLPRMIQVDRDRDRLCPTCGSANLTKRGFHNTNVSRFQTWQCMEDGCGRYSRTYEGALEPRGGLIPV